MFIGPNKNAGATTVATIPTGKRGKLANVQPAPAPPPAADNKTLGTGILPANGFSPPPTGGALAFTSPTGAEVAAGEHASPSPGIPMPRVRPKRLKKK